MGDPYDTTLAQHSPLSNWKNRTPTGRYNIVMVGDGTAGLVAEEVSLGPNEVEVNDHLRTSNPSIYTERDVASRIRFAHAAKSLARTALQNGLFLGWRRATTLAIPWCT